MDKYGAGQDSYCFPGTSVLRNRLHIQHDSELAVAEREFSELAASEMAFSLPPYDLVYLKRVHRLLFQDVYEWAGELRTLDISKGRTRFCTVGRIEHESSCIFASMASAQWFEGYERGALIVAVAQSFGDLNMIHPFREGNGRAQRILFEHLLLNAGFQVDWWQVNADEWVAANIAAVVCDYEPLEGIFERCLSRSVII